MLCRSHGALDFRGRAGYKHRAPNGASLMGATKIKKPRAGRNKASNTPVTFDTVRQIAQTLPGAEESTSYGTPAFKVRGKLFARLHQDGESLVVGVNFEEREEMMSADPDKFYITDHYLNYPWMLVRMSKVRPDQLRDLLIRSWRRAAPKQLVATFHKFGAS